MARRGPSGPAPTDTAILKKRGSWRGAAREKAEKQAKAAKKPRLRLVKQKWPEPPIPKTAAQWRNLIKSLPGYDPYVTTAKCRFDSRRARKAIEFFHTQLKHVKGEKVGTPFYLEPWQQAVIGNLFGWRMWHEDEDGNGEWRRRYRETLIFIPRKNGKTPIAAGIILYGLFEDGEPCAEIYGAASEYRQAGFVFAHARGMVEQNPDLADRCQVFKGQAQAIELHSDHSVYRVISADSSSKHGFNTHMAVIDELHTQRDRDLVDTLITSTGARRDPLIVHITTSDFEGESICNEKHKYACRVRDNGGDPSKPGDDPAFLPVIYEASLEDDYADRKVWKKVNPNLGISVSWEYIQREYLRAKDEPSYENTFKRLHLNIRTEQDVRWIKMDVWDACNTPVDIHGLANQECYGGLDLASTQDTTAFVLVFPREDDCYDVLPFFWIPGEAARKRERRDRVSYLTWERQSRITLTDGDVCDYTVLRRDLNELASRFKIKEIAYDRWNASHLVQQLQDGDGFEMVEFGQGFKDMAGPTKELERLLVAGRLRHGGHPVLRAQACHVAVKTDEAGNIKPNKKTSTDRIDGIVATIMALGRAMMRTDKESHYNKHELFVI